MKKDIYLSIEIQNLREDLADILNENPLPFCVKRMVFKELISILDELANKEYNNDITQKEKAENDKTESTGDHEEDRVDDGSDVQDDAG